MKKENHSFKPICKKSPHMCCEGCGLVPLNNQITAICIDAGCNYEESLKYKRWKNNGYKF